MSYLAEIPQDTLSIEIAHVPLFLPPRRKITASAQLGKVILFIDERPVELSTVVAHEIGMIVAKAIPNLEPGEMILLIINGERIELIGNVAEKFYVALLRKADQADDWQLLNRRKLQ